MNSSQVLDGLNNQTDPSTYVSDKGVKFRLHKVPNLLVQDAVNRLEAPRPPMVWIEDKEANEENPNDPNFKEQYQKYTVEKAMLAAGIYFIKGVTAYTDSITPESGVRQLDDASWSDEVLELAGIDVPDKGPRRTLAWLKYEVLTDSDFQPLMQAIMRFSGGTLEVDVNEAADAFRDTEERGPAAGVDAAEETARGDRAPTV